MGERGPETQNEELDPNHREESICADGDVPWRNGRFQGWGRWALSKEVLREGWGHGKRTQNPARRHSHWLNQNNLNMKNEDSNQR